MPIIGEFLGRETPQVAHSDSDIYGRVLARRASFLTRAPPVAF